MRIAARSLSLLLVCAAAPVLAGTNDLALLNLCEHRTPAVGLKVPECSWIQRAADGRIQALSLDADAQSRFRSLMSELGVVMAPRLVIPAETLGSSGFQVSAEVGTTTISGG